MENFQVPTENLITLEQCCELKKKNIIEIKADARNISDIEIVMNEFKDILKCPLGTITPDMIREISNKMLESTVRRGGLQSNNTGSLRITSPATVLRKLRSLAAVIGFMIQKGANITNPAQVVVNQVKMSLIKKGVEIDE